MIKTPPSFHIMLKPRASICNLDCKYCYYLSKRNLYPESDCRMNDNTLEEFIHQYINAQRVPEVTFGWQGGEPTLMGLDFFKRAVRLQKKYARPGMQIYNTLQTNGTLLNDEWGKFFYENSFLIGLSLDGPPQLHNTYRIDKEGNPTFARVKKGLDILKRYNIEFNILTCVHAANAEYPLEVYRFLRDEIGTKFIQFIPIVERDNDTGFQEGNKITSRSVTGRQYGKFLITIFNEWVRRDVGRVFVQIFDIALGAWLGMLAALCIFTPTCGTALAMEHNGDLYACDHFVEPKHKRGNFLDASIVKLVGSQEQFTFGQNKYNLLPTYCRECKVSFVCNGGCPKNRVLSTRDGEPGLNYLCEGYKAFFTYIDPYMQFMAEQLRNKEPAAKIMEHLTKNNF